MNGHDSKGSSRGRTYALPKPEERGLFFAVACIFSDQLVFELGMDTHIGFE